MGIDRKTLKEGSGQEVKKTDIVKINCTGTFENGTKFWSTKDPDQEPYEFPVGEQKVIRGFDEGVIGMKPGEVAVVTVPPEAGYSTQGFSAWGIPPNATLVFEIEVLAVREGKPGPS